MTWRSGDCVAHCWCDTILQKVRQRCASDDHPFSSAISKRARRMRPALYRSLRRASPTCVMYTMSHAIANFSSFTREMYA